MIVSAVRLHAHSLNGAAAARRPPALNLKNKPSFYALVKSYSVPYNFLSWNYVVDKGALAACVWQGQASNFSLVHWRHFNSRPSGDDSRSVSNVFRTAKPKSLYRMCQATHYGARYSGHLPVVSWHRTRQIPKEKPAEV